MAQTVFEVLSSGGSVRDLKITPIHKDYEMLTSFNLLSAKPTLLVANVEESCASQGNIHSKQLIEWANENHSTVVVASAQLEFELAVSEDQQTKKEFMEAYGLTEPAISQIIRKSFELLSMDVFYTIGKKEVRAWPVRKGATARECAGTIHTDFIKGFIKAERWNADDFISKRGQGYTIDIKGADYIVQPGDCFLFKIR